MGSRVAFSFSPALLGSRRPPVGFPTLLLGGWFASRLGASVPTSPVASLPGSRPTAGALPRTRGFGRGPGGGLFGVALTWWFTQGRPGQGRLPLPHGAWADLSPVHPPQARLTPPPVGSALPELLRLYDSGFFFPVTTRPLPWEGAPSHTRASAAFGPCAGEYGQKPTTRLVRGFRRATAALQPAARAVWALAPHAGRQLVRSDDAVARALAGVLVRPARRPRPQFMYLRRRPGMVRPARPARLAHPTPTRPLAPPAGQRQRASGTPPAHPIALTPFGRWPSAQVVAPGSNASVDGVGQLDLDLTNLRPPFANEYVQYRPGFATAWRHFREVYAGLGSVLVFPRQHRLTRLVTRTRRVVGFAYLCLLELSLGHVGRSSLLGGSAPGVWLLNGQLCGNPYAQLYAGDFLTLIRCARRSRAAAPARDTAVYLEVDELTRTCLVVCEPTRGQQLTYGGPEHPPFLSHRLYNWKYTT